MQTFRFDGDLWTLDQLQRMLGTYRKICELLVENGAPEADILRAREARDMWRRRYYSAEAMASTMPGAEDHEDTDWEENNA
jgi:hypothetical protein